jgi:hypothetical protein
LRAQEALLKSLGDLLPVLTAASRAERATMRAARELELARRQVAPNAAPGALDDGLAARAADLQRLTGCHRGTYLKLEWRDLAAREPVAVPVRAQARERAARQALTTYAPSWRQRMFGDEGQRRRELAAKIAQAASADEAEFQKAFRAAEAHNGEILLARRLLQMEPGAIKEAVATKTRLREAHEAMNAVSLALPGAGRIVAVVEAIQEADVPHDRVADEGRRTARREPISPAERRQLHLAAVCAAALRVGADFVSVLPVDAVEVVVCCELPRRAGERARQQAVAQLLMTTRLLGELDWKRGDAVTLAAAIGMRMDWSIETGFAPIRPVALSAMDRPLAQSA